MRFQVAWEGMVVALNPAAAEPSNVEEHLDRVMQELLEIDAQDISISLVGSEGLVEMSVTPFKMYATKNMSAFGFPLAGSS